MTLAPQDTQSFMRTYARVLLDAHGSKADRLVGQRRTEALVAGRAKLLKKPEFLKDDSRFMPEDDVKVRQAIRGLIFARWIYLRDTSRFSILVDPERRTSYAVLGLTDPLAEIFGGAGVSFEAGVCPFGDQFLCDGLFVDAVRIGPNMRGDFRALHSEIARTGRFYKHP